MTAPPLFPYIVALRKLFFLMFVNIIQDSICLDLKKKMSTTSKLKLFYAYAHLIIFIN
jgi:hypothetical protein